ncbi:hypothetical protein RchiOBHm_Chr2g0116741 [Rosa chinensis]|uniref:Uncharacterized protein n=1 Tax=Rosa chinensis TaxID=74649 RepID=A0A2P6RRB4_ROSCH|nr:hypothetical protein RchiOBHm_Chr2g0116741 [Rosa chinensis]
MLCLVSLDVLGFLPVCLFPILLDLGFFGLLVQLGIAFFSPKERRVIKVNARNYSKYVKHVQPYPVKVLRAMDLGFTNQIPKRYAKSVRICLPELGSLKSS